MKEDIIRFSGLAALVVGFSAVFLSMYREGLQIVSYRPLSYLGTTDSAALFGGGLIAGVVLMLPFYAFLARHYNLSPGFGISIFLMLAGLVVIALTRDEIGGQTNMVHWYAVWTFIVSRILALIFFSWDNPHTVAGRISRITGLILLLALGPELLLSVSDIVTDSSQLLNMAVFGAWVISASLSVPDGEGEKNLTNYAIQSR